MRVETWKYEYAHGKKPRGFGLWWFDIVLNYDSSDRLLSFTTLTFTGSYTEAKRAAVKQAKQLKAREVFVCS